jgi:hypothetical protein
MEMFGFILKFRGGKINPIYPCLVLDFSETNLGHLSLHVTQLNVLLSIITPQVCAPTQARFLVLLNVICTAMLGGSLLKTTWRVLRLRVEETALSYVQCRYTVNK